MSQNDHCAGSRITRCMGSVKLVIEACADPEERGNMRASIQPTRVSNGFAPIHINVPRYVALDLRLEADAQHFTELSDAKLWLFNRARELAGTVNAG